MKKIVYTITTFILLVLITGCSTVPFKYTVPSSNTVTIYTYVVMPSSINENESDPCYKIEINDKFLKECMKIDEFMEFKNLKPQTITIAAIRDDIDKKKMNLTLKAGETYFLKVQTQSQIIGQFEFTHINKDEALKSITSMKMANPPETEEDGILDFFASEDKNETATKEDAKESVTTSSKMDEIQKASEMKDQGIISAEEFNKLKTEILNAK